MSLSHIVHLPSNTPDPIYENKTSNYRVQLAKPIDFCDDNWEVGLRYITYPYTWYDVPVPAKCHVITVLPSAENSGQRLLLSAINITRYNDTTFTKPHGAHPLVPFAFWVIIKTSNGTNVDTWYFAVSENAVLPMQYETEYANDAAKLASFINAKGTHYFSPTDPSIRISAGVQQLDDMIFGFTVNPLRPTKYLLGNNPVIVAITITIPNGIYRTPERLLGFIADSNKTLDLDNISSAHVTRAAA
jgi:hypothetical protein